MHKLADVLAGKDSETIFDFFVALSTTHMMDQASAAAQAGDLGTADAGSRVCRVSPSDYRRAGL